MYEYVWYTVQCFKNVDEQNAWCRTFKPGFIHAIAINTMFVILLSLYFVKIKCYDGSLIIY